MGACDVKSVAGIESGEIEAWLSQVRLCSAADTPKDITTEGTLPVLWLTGAAPDAAEEGSPAVALEFEADLLAVAPAEVLEGEDGERWIAALGCASTLVLVGQRKPGSL